MRSAWYAANTSVSTIWMVSYRFSQLRYWVGTCREVVYFANGCRLDGSTRWCLRLYPDGGLREDLTTRKIFLAFLEQNVGQFRVLMTPSKISYTNETTKTGTKELSAILASKYDCKIMFRGSLWFEINIIVENICGSIIICLLHFEIHLLSWNFQDHIGRRVFPLDTKKF